MYYDLILTTQFKKAVKRLKRRGFNIQELMDVIDLLREGKTLAPSFRDHALSGNYIGFRECHIKPDWLLIYTIDNEELILTATHTGTHSDLFGK